jgi:hypothetical protein
MAHRLRRPHIQAAELLRDPLTFAIYSAAEWVQGLVRAGLAVTSARSYRLRIEFSSWIARTRTTPLHAQAIRALQDASPAEVRRFFVIEDDGSFMLDMMMFEAGAH